MEQGSRNGPLGAWGTICAVLVAATGLARADDEEAELRRLVEAQGRQLRALQEKARQRSTRTERPALTSEAAEPPKLDEGAVKRIVADYLKANPGAGMPPGVQTGYELGRGYAIRSAPNPAYVQWDDDCRIPFELRTRVRLQLAYLFYKVTDRTNHVTNLPATQNANAIGLADFSQLEVKRLNIIFQGTAFDPDLRYNFNIQGTTRGLPGLQNNKVVQTTPAGGLAPNAAGVSPLGGGVLVDHAVNLFEAFVAYDFHGCACEKGCGPDCPDARPRYCPTYTLIVGKLKPFFGLDEFLGSANEQFVEFSMADLFFDADDDTRLFGAGFQVKAFEDRFFLQALVTNGSEGSFQPNTQMDDYPGFICGFWYDFGGSWNQPKKTWDLFGDCISDIDYSCCPVVRAGGCINLVPMDRRSLYGDAEQSRFFTLPGGIGGTRLINVLNGDLTASTPPAPGAAVSATAGSHAVDEFDAYTFNAFLAGKYRGFSVCNEWWLRDLTGFKSPVTGGGRIIYQDTLGPKETTANALFPNHSLLDYGTTLQAGYFLIPKKLEVAARWSWVRGESGDVNGTGKFKTVFLPGVVSETTGAPVPIHVVQGAFRQFHEADEYTVGVNYFFKRHLLKWQTDFGIYDGGNPAAGGAPIAGFVAGADGYLIRTQMQMFF
jgi:hypothetical protein